MAYLLKDSENSPIKHKEKAAHGASVTLICQKNHSEILKLFKKSVYQNKFG